MSKSLGYRVVLTGELLEGHPEEHALAALAALTRRTEQEVAHLLQGKPHVVRRGLALPEAVRYREVLERAGTKAVLVAEEATLDIELPADALTPAQVADNAVTFAPVVQRQQEPPTVSLAKQQEPPPIPAPALWNPNAAANWSLLFSPLFGAWLHAKNWDALGEHARATRARWWAWGGLGVAYGVALYGVVQDIPATGGAFFLWLLLWYFISARPQVRLVKARFGQSYPRKPWKTPLWIAFPLWLPLLGLAGIDEGAGLSRTASTTSVAGASKSSSAANPLDDPAPTGRADELSGFPWVDDPWDVYPTVDEFGAFSTGRGGLGTGADGECEVPGAARALERITRTTLTRAADRFNANQNRRRVVIGEVEAGPVHTVRLGAPAGGDIGCEALVGVSGTMTLYGEAPQLRTVRERVLVMLTRQNDGWFYTYYEIPIRTQFGALFSP